MKRVLILLAIAVPILAQVEEPYTDEPEIVPPYYQVRYEASDEPGQLGFDSRFTVWIPEGVETLRGVIVHQHGCGTGSARSGLTGAFDLHWQALAREHECALLSPVYEYVDGRSCLIWCDPTQGSDAAFRRSLADLSELSGHPELAEVPWALWGHSGGAFWSAIMTHLHPDRVAATWMRSGALPMEQPPDREKIKLYDVSEEMLSIPMMVNLGTEEGVTVKEGRFARVWPAATLFVGKLREQDGLAAISVDPLTGHQCGNQRYLAIPWFDACLEARLPEAVGGPIQPLDHDAGVLVPFHLGEAVPVTEFEGDATEMGWLINEEMGEAWETYVNDTTVIDTTPPPAPFKLELSEEGKLTWQAHADLESGIEGFVIKRNGEIVGELPEKNRNPFGRPLFQGLQHSDTPKYPLEKMEFLDPEPADSVDAYEVISRNVAGLESGS